MINYLKSIENLSKQIYVDKAQTIALNYIKVRDFQSLLDIVSADIEKEESLFTSDNDECQANAHYINLLNLKNLLTTYISFQEC